MKWILFTMLNLANIGAYYSVPNPVRDESNWAVIPLCGYILAAEYHFGNKMNAPAASASAAVGTSAQQPPTDRANIPITESRRINP